ncbi:fungal specific transcription factor domain-containing protein [Aspergillus alliaceus]|uniref:fungal specific transcription factor domain-containing protein n=1 Tax=Petromyces alliaceus TaxID=209559 RepID=UPI0012A4E3CE|nr:uncharacterized protein BDW43DRAFT_313320 [Aspergillus alliaceus]KAB8231246.1 hypothetical protein BDW43DRAFT_313320 [Aspergillus alliaceus]
MCAYNRPHRRTTGRAAFGSTAWNSDIAYTLSERIQNLEQLIDPGNSSLHPTRPHSGSPVSSAFSTSVQRKTPASPNDEDTKMLNPIIDSWPRAKIRDQLTNALYKSRRIMLQDAPVCTSEDNFSMPPERAKVLIEDCLEQLKGDLFIGLVDAELMKSLPDIIDKVHVHLHASVLLVYYLLLCQGHLIREDGYRSCGDIVSRLYLKCINLLPQWRQGATANTTYLVGALLMSLIAAENQDFDLSWSLHRQACQFAQLLDLHNLDRYQDPSSVDTMTFEHKRHGFWQLIQADLNFCLYHDVPPTIFATDWTVNIPWLGFNLELDGAGYPPVNIASFIANSRLTFIGMGFLEAIGKATVDPYFDLESCIESTCGKIRVTIQEWNLEDRFHKSSLLLDKLFLADALLAGLNFIIIMNSKLPCFFPSSSCKHWKSAVQTARHIVEIVLEMGFPSPSDATIRRIFFLRPFLAVLTLYENLAVVTDEMRCKDILSLGRLQKVLAIGAEYRPDLVPIVEVMESLAHLVRGQGTHP